MGVAEKGATWGTEEAGRKGEGIFSAYWTTVVSESAVPQSKFMGNAHVASASQTRLDFIPLSSARRECVERVP